MSKKDRIIEIVRNLSKRTVANGCTEAEAQAAVEKADELMREYQLSMSDVSEVDNDTYGAGKRAGYGKFRKGVYDAKGHPFIDWHPVGRCLSAIAKFCGVRHWKGMSDATITFFGAQVDVELAFFLVDTVKAAMDTEWRTYKGLTGSRGVAGFKFAMASRVSDRLNEMADRREYSGNQQVGLMVIRKDAVVDQRFKAYTQAKGIRLRDVRARTQVYHHDSIGAGRAAGDRVGLHRPVGSGHAVKHVEG